MATQTLPPDHRQMLDAVDPRHEPVLRSLAVDQAGAYAEEVRVLRRKVAALEAALEVAHAARLSEQTGSCCHGRVDFDLPAPSAPYVVAASEFVAPLAPAVAPIGSPNHCGLAEPAANAEAAVAASTASFAAAWGDEQATFEERFAAKAFFQVGAVDEASRQWLLSADQR